MRAPHRGAAGPGDLTELFPPPSFGLVLPPRPAIVVAIVVATLINIISVFDGLRSSGR